MAKEGVKSRQQQARPRAPDHQVGIQTFIGPILWAKLAYVGNQTCRLYLFLSKTWGVEPLLCFIEFNEQI
jgi:hypothetical protein